MRILRHPLFLLALALFLVNQRMEALGYHLPVIHAWLDDLLCMPVILTLSLTFQRVITYKNPEYRFSWIHVMVAVVHISIIFEAVLPVYSSRFTADPLDVIAYSLGALVFYFGINPSPKEKLIRA